MPPLAVASGLVFVFAVILFAVVLLVVLFRADDRDQADEEAEAESRSPLP
jgi:cbb3-type cytochrome oxidase subunit 3